LITINQYKTDSAMERRTVFLCKYSALVDLHRRATKKKEQDMTLMENGC